MTERYQGFSFDQAALREEVDLDVERRKEILFVEANLAKFTHFQVLGITWDDTAAAARAAYLAKVKIFHPDQYAGQVLGSYRARLEKIFRRLTEARDVLGDEVRRASYRLTTASPDRLATLEAGRLEDERRSEERRARLAQRNPILRRVARLKSLVDRGKQAIEEGHFIQGANDLRVALAMDDRNEEIASLIVEAEKKADLAKAVELFEAGAHCEALGRPLEALEAFKKAFAMNATHVLAASSAARLALVVGNRSEARGYAEAALKAGPRVGRAYEAMGLVLEAEGSKKEARKLFEKAIELDPRLEGAQQRLKKLRWSLRG